MSTPLVSIVVPVYNGEKYLEECLNSIRQQTVSDWECIVINDGSTDNSLSIIGKFVALDPRFSCKNIPNSGSAKTPIDTGIVLANAYWLTVIGQDDFYDVDALERMLNRAEEINADIVYIRMKFFYDALPDIYFCTIPSEDFDMGQVIYGKEAVMLTIPDWKIGANGALIKYSLWKNLSALNRGLNHMNVDEYDTRELLINAQRVAFVDVGYNYRRHPDSITKKISIKLFDTLITDKMLEELLVKHFGYNSMQAMQIRKQRMNGILGRQFFLFKYKSFFSTSDQKRIKKMFKIYYTEIDKKRIYGKKLKQILLTNGYFLFNISVFLLFLLHKVRTKNNLH